MLATGAGVALTSHALKAGSRLLLNASPEPVSNVLASGAEDVMTVGALALAFAYPWLALAVVTAVALPGAWALWWLWRRLAGRTPRRAPG